MNCSDAPLTTHLQSAALPFGAKDSVMASGVGGYFRQTFGNVSLLMTAGAVWFGIRRLSGGILAAWLAHGMTDAGRLTWSLLHLGYLGS